MRKIRMIAAALVLSMLTMATAGAQQADNNAGADMMTNMFDPNSWMNMMGMTGSMPGYGAPMGGTMGGAMGGNPYQWMMMPGNWVNPNMYMQFMNPNTYMAMMNPNNMMAMMNPAMYMQLMNPMAYMQLMNPAAYMAWMNPATYTQGLNAMMQMGHSQAGVPAAGSDQ